MTTLARFTLIVQFALWAACGAPDPLEGLDPPSAASVFREDAVGGMCTDWTECAFPRLCRACPAGMAPSCAAPECVDGQCGVVSPCSRPVECGAQVRCVHPNVCRFCPPGHGPGCASAECIDGLCVQIAPCSRRR